MKLGLLKKREMWWPTWKGWLLLLVLGLVVPGWWWFRGEAFLSVTRKVEADVLVVEGWIDKEGIRTAAAEFKKGGYEWVVAAGGLTEHSWSPQRWSYAEVGAEELQRAGIDPARILQARARESDSDRTYETAVAVRRILEEHGIEPSGINVVTTGAHARRSGLVFAKVFESKDLVGVIAWLPPGFETGNWRDSSERAKEFVMESVGYAYEWVFSSGRESGRLAEDLSREEETRAADSAPE